MPVQWRLHVLEERLHEMFGDEVAVEVTDLAGLEPSEQQTVIDAMVTTQAGLPITLVNGRVVCTDEIDLDAIVACIHENAQE